jgi:hypothetical protein
MIAARSAAAKMLGCSIEDTNNAPARPSLNPKIARLFDSVPPLVNSN